MSLTISNTGLNLIKKFEGCVLKAYQDSAGVWTIGYGHTLGVKNGQVITQVQAEEYLKSDCATAESAVNSYNSKYNWNQNQFDALVSFTFNCGSGNLKTLLQNGTRTITQISAMITAYNKAGGKVLSGLTKRRNAEKELFDKVIATTAQNSVTSSKSKLNVTSNIKAVQTWLNTNYKTGLAADGIYGAKTKAALVKAWQTEVGGLVVDGIFGTKSRTVAATHIIKKYSTGILVTIWQAYLVCRGYNPGGIDGMFGTGCYTATIAFQKSSGLVQDGCVGQNTWSKAFGE